jgi:hypothetical protein
LTEKLEDHPGPIPIEKASPALAEVCFVIADQYWLTSSRDLRWHLRTSLKWLIRDLEQYVQPRVSRRAQAKALELGLPDLHRMVWADQRTKMKDPERSIFHWEHVTQVADMTDSILNLNPRTKSDIESILHTAMVAWILKEEDRALPRGPRSDSLNFYKDNGIVLVDLP